eukprot:scaffold25135_cov45-Phaeocystis_antarctica.AAC.1
MGYVAPVPSLRTPASSVSPRMAVGDIGGTGPETLNKVFDPLKFSEYGSDKTLAWCGAGLTRRLQAPNFAPSLPAATSNAAVLVPPDPTLRRGARGRPCEGRHRAAASAQPRHLLSTQVPRVGAEARPCCHARVGRHRVHRLRRAALRRAGGARRHDLRQPRLRPVERLRRAAVPGQAADAHRHRAA